ncbi:unnamed protein product [Oikopleura dioica]|uniref:Uncharacterized protein n=1 Tax=Oikopleura dioica TaxID=34765 RepID=E4YKQ4_OIKDI|nr:unnamed protein product [Oikopleura dioica]
MSRRTSQATSRASFKSPPVQRDPNMKETVISFNIKGGQNLSATKDGSEMFLRLSFGSFTAESEYIEAKTEASNVKLAVKEEISGTNTAFYDNLVRFPLTISLLEMLPKEKKQKEDKIICHREVHRDLSPFLKGKRKISESVREVSKEAPNIQVNLEISVSISPELKPEFLEKNRIMTLRLIHASGVPDSWLGSSFNACLPIQKEENETAAVKFSGKAEGAFNTSEKMSLYWSGLKNTTEKIISKENYKLPENGAAPANSDGECPNAIVFSSERKMIMSADDCRAFEARIAKVSNLLPLEISKYFHPFRKDAAKKGKAKPDDGELHNHGIALINLESLLYPGVKTVSGKFKVNPFTQNQLIRAGYGESITASSCNSGTILSMGSTSRNDSSSAGGVSDNRPESRQAAQDALPYKELNSSVFFEISFSRALVDRATLQDLDKNLATLIPMRPKIPRKKYGAEISVEEYKSQITEVAKLVLAEIRAFAPSTKGESFEKSLLYQLNRTGKHAQFHENF